MANHPALLTPQDAVMRQRGVPLARLLAPPRGALLATTGLIPAAAAIALLAQPLPAIAACAEAAGSATCTGNLAAGVDYNNSGVTNVTISGVTGNIAPAIGPAIRLIGAGANGENGSNPSDTSAPGVGGHGTIGPNLTLNASLGGATATSVTAQAVVVRSRGGDGGRGGSGAAAGSRDGRPGGDGAAGGTVNVTLTGRFTSFGTETAAIAAQSLGGNGGNGGNGSAEMDGGDGGGSGAGGNVNLRTTARVDTIGDAQVGIAALSQGGIAGNGGDERGVFVGSGGSGGGASAGGNAIIYSQSEVHTAGVSSIGIFAQSLGGQGGSGASAGSLFYSSGGDGVYGAAGGLAQATNAAGGAVFTTGAVAHGILALSVGGGGGSGGSGSGIVGLGSTGGTGGAGGTARVVNNGLVDTSGFRAVGLMAQSVGGGGGDGGRGSGIVGFGGRGSGTSSGGSVTVSNTWRVVTRGERAEGIFAQSVGGGGGRGGSSSGVVSFGGPGGGGGNGGAVNVTNTGSVETFGIGATGIVAQSVGGGGGAGGGAVAAGTTFAMAFGGTGGKGGNGGVVGFNTAIVTPAPSAPAPSVITHGDGAIGVFAQSVGGGGGASGSAVAVAASVDYGFSLAMGATGGDGGQGGNVTSRYRGSVTTAGDNATGMLLQSVGGGGGNAGASVAAAGGAIASLAASIGGGGGRGGVGGTVVFNGAADIVTTGDTAMGLVAQSIGGGGGNGGSAMSGAIAGAFSANVALGGTAGSGGQGGTVSVGNAATIHTTGLGSHALVAQSIGGGGGNGGFALGVGLSVGGSASVTLGGRGAAGGTGGNVTLTHATVEPANAAPGRNYGIRTEGDGAHGVVVQSIGGGGGTGGIAGSISGAGLGAVSVALGGVGGIGATGGTVTARIDGPIDTFGARAIGLLAQSVGGGGGDGGMAFSGAVAQYGAISVGLGGDGSQGGTGGVVSVTGDGRVATRGDGATGILVQSIGGGGGTGGASLGASGVLNGASVAVTLGGTGGSGGAAGAVTLNRGGTVTTGVADDGTGERGGHGAHAVVAQSIGGGGGTGGWVGSLALSLGNGVNTSIALGGDGGIGGLGGTVNVTQRGAVRTWGDNSFGILAQSVGGGGGDGGMAFGIAATLGKGGAITATLGGDGVVGGNAGAASATVRGPVTTAGDLSSAIIVQSIGGGGGTGGVAAGLGFAGKGGALAATLGGSGGGGGHAGAATVSTTGAISTFGDLAHGVLAQSIGGGGGSGGIAAGGALVGDGLAVQATLGGSGGAAGNGSLVTISQSGGLSTRGDGAHGILGQSIGGGGGDGGMAIGVAATTSNNPALGATLGGGGQSGGAGGAVVIGSSGVLSTQGALSHGILAQSVGGGGGNGGMALSGGFSAGSQASITLGGNGAAGGAGAAVSVTRRFNATAPMPNGSDTRLLSAYGLPGGTNATLSTQGGGSHGVVAQSIGGGGGNGGLAGTLLVGLGKDAGSAALSVGGTGGAGGAGGRVSVVVVDRIATGGAAPAYDSAGSDSEALAYLRAAGLSAEGGAARGVVAQSIGGGGGDGGGAIAIGLTSSETTRTANVAIGGSGEVGGAGGIATAIVIGAVQTAGAHSDAVLVQSIGGGGGSGGFSIAGSLSTGEGNAVTLSLGGSGDGGGNAALAHATFQGNILTTGDSARGVVAQSIGGGGGVGGLSFAGTGNTSATGGGNSATFSLGGSGGAGGHGGTAEVRILGLPTQPGSITTQGQDAHAIVAQSIGGGGGMGGMAIAAYVGRLGTERSFNAVGAVGGSGDAGGNGGRVNVANLANLTTRGLNAHGIVAQSIGGGGGMGGGSISAMVRLGTPGENYQVGANIAVGGSGAGGGAGGLVTVSNDGLIRTFADGSHGVFAQSIGGGGGAGGASNAITFNLGQAPDAPPAGEDSPDSKVLTLSLAIGGSGGGGGNGGVVNVTNNAAIVTAGHAAHGLYTQSIGGGGGTGGDGRQGFEGLAPPGTGVLIALGVKLAGKDRSSFLRNIVVSVGGSGGASGHGRGVTATNQAAITTTGDWSQAIFAQSIGGGGGSGGLGLGGLLGRLSIGGEGLGGGAGGTVSVQNLATGTLRTEGAHANAIVAQSIGGGGGAGGGGGGIITIGRTGGGGGDGGTVTVENAAGITTLGGFGAGILAQSVGGGGGLGGGSGLGDKPLPGVRIISIGAASGSSGRGGTVNVVNTGDIGTTGAAAFGIVAQSIGGGGGIGHFEVPAPPAMTPEESLLDSIIRISARPIISIGATGAAGGNGGSVSVVHDGAIVTRGGGAHGLLAQSIGGGGGVGTGTGLNDIGSRGGSGGIGGNASVTLNDGTILTLGLGAHGVLAQSIGGGGGAGHANLDLQGRALVAGTDDYSGRIGASGGTSGDANAVTVALGAGAEYPGGSVSGARVEVRGAAAIGVLAQSIGGGGGVSGGDTAGANGIDLGASGAGGAGASVTVQQTSALAQVIARGAGGAGIVAQSIGGGGGYATGTPAAIRLGSNNAMAGDGRIATVAIAGSVLTTGADSPAVIVQSIGGGGGMAGLAGTGMTLGANSATGGPGGLVRFRNDGVVQATGARSVGVLAQAVVGGGGYGIGTTGGALRLGGTGTTGAPAQVEITAGTGRMVAAGESGIALVAQGISGGGGFVGRAGGDATLGGSASGRGSHAYVDAPGALVAVGVGGAAGIVQSVGGGGGIVASVGGDVSMGGTPRTPSPLDTAPDITAAGGIVRVTGLGEVTGGGVRTIGLVAQSIGGGGGTVLQAGGAVSLGGTQPGDGGPVTVSGADADILTPGAGLIAQSIGGGGGLVVSAGGALTLGGSTASTGGEVTLNLGGVVQTTANGAPAVVAQSIGGGGGAVLAGGAATLLGGSGGGHGGTVTIDTEAAIDTAGRGSVGILAQSIGGGGGMALGSTGPLVAGALGGIGDGATVDVTNRGVITTRGAAAHGILAQSIGGGGGAFLGPVAAGQVTDLLAGNGNGGAVTVSNRADISVAGPGAHGIVAQSLGGGGAFAGSGGALPGASNTGRSGSAGGIGTGGEVRVVTSAAVQASGGFGIGILAESAGGSGAGPVFVNVEAAGSVLGAANGTGVALRGNHAVLDNQGSVGSVGGVAGRAVWLQGATGGIFNFGTITGSIDTTGLAVNNLFSGVINSGPRINLGTGTLHNSASLAIGGRGAIGTTALTGNFRQHGDGTLRVDVEGQAASIRADRLNVSGTARLNGTVAAELLPGTTLPPGTHSATIIRAAGGVTLDSPPALTATPTLNTSWALSYPNPNDVNLSVTLTTTAPSARMSSNQRSVASALNGAATSNPTGFASYSGSVYGATDAGSYSASMSSLGGDGGMASMLAAQGASHQFMMGITARLDLLQRSHDAGMAAPASFAPFAFGSAFGDEGATLSGEAMLGMNSVADTMPSLTRFWAMPLGYGGRMDAGAALGTSAESRVGGFMMGFDHQLAPNLLVGAVGGYSNGSYDAGQLIARGQLEGGHMGAYAMWRSGPLYMTGALAYARHEAKQSRIIGLEDQAEYARGNSGMHNASANLEFGARFDLGGFALSPFAGVGVNAWRQDGGTEVSTAVDGSGGVLGLTQQARSDYSMPISLGMRWDTTFAGPLGLALTPYVRAAWVHETRTSLTSTASFALAADQSFNLVTPRTARDRLSMNLGVQMAPHERLGFGFGIIGDVGDGVQSIGGFGRMVVRW